MSDDQGISGSSEWVPFMQRLETRYQSVSGLTDRRDYKIYYSPVRSAAILTLGDNPGGDPKEIRPGAPGASASDGYFENNEHDLLDCSWPENQVLKLLVPLVGGARERVREQVVKTNLAFRRSRTNKALAFGIGQAMDEAVPFLEEILAVVQPSLVHLSGPNIEEFSRRYGSGSIALTTPIRDSTVRKTVFDAAKIRVRKTNRETLVVQTSHASQFSWTYEKYSVMQRIKQLGFVW